MDACARMAHWLSNFPISPNMAPTHYAPARSREVELGISYSCELITPIHSLSPAQLSIKCAMASQAQDRFVHIYAPHQDGQVICSWSQPFLHVYPGPIQKQKAEGRRVTG